jgi:hypothetical protein
LEHSTSAVRSARYDLTLPPTNTLEPPPGVIDGNLLRLFRQFVDLREDRQKCCPQFGQVHGAPTHKEFTTQEGLEPPNSIAYGGLPHATFLSRSHEVALLSDSKKVSNLLEFHCTSPFDRRSSNVLPISPSPGRAAMTIFSPCPRKTDGLMAG